MPCILTADVFMSTGLSNCELSNLNRVLSCTLANLGGGASQAYPVQVRAVDVGVRTSSAIVSSVTPDSNLNNNGPVNTTITVTRTCGTFFANGSRFICGGDSEFNTSSSGFTDPGQTTCCVSGTSYPSCRLCYYAQLAAQPTCSVYIHCVSWLVW